MDYSSVTEHQGQLASHEQLQRLYQRYHFAVTYCTDKSSVLEAACGSGIGLGYLARFAKKVVGGDIDENNLKFAMEHYKGRENIEIKKLDAQQLPFDNNSFDVVLLYEAIYYLPQPEKFLQEAHRVLKEDGILVIGTVNKDWSDFNPSPYSIRYFSAPELFLLLKPLFEGIELYGAFAARANTPRDRIISLIKRGAVMFHLMPKTMKGKELFKRIFFGKLVSIPPEIQGNHDYFDPIALPPDASCTDYKVLYAVGRNKKV